MPLFSRRSAAVATLALLAACGAAQAQGYGARNLDIPAGGGRAAARAILGGALDDPGYATPFYPEPGGYPGACARNGLPVYVGDGQFVVYPPYPGC